MSSFFNLEKTIKKQLKGKTLVNLKFGSAADPVEAEEGGTRYANLPAKIQDAYLGVDCGDAGIWLDLEDHEDAVFVYDNETVKISVSVEEQEK